MTHTWDRGELPTVSVVVPVYNSEETIGACVSSILALDYPRERRELVVVDNGSGDATRTELMKFGDELVVVDESTRGPAAARNRGIATARHDVIAFTDADCTVDRQWLRHLIVPLANPEVGIAGGKILSRQPCNWIEAFGDKIHDHQRAMTEYRPHYVITMNWASRRVLLTHHRFDERFVRNEDADLAYRIESAGYRLAYVPGAIVRHANQRTLRGLFAEGYKHGFWYVYGAKVHRDYMAEVGHVRCNWRTYASILTSARDAVRGPGRPEAVCDVVFNAGKKLGKYVGSVRFWYAEL